MTYSEASLSLLPHDLPTPALLLDERRFLRNVERMRHRAAALKVVHRPHLKTAKSFEVARRLLPDLAAPAIVSTVAEAEYFAACGLRDLLYGIGIAPGKLDRLGTIRSRYGAGLKLILDSVEQARAVAAWSRKNGKSLPALIEIDCDGHRSGVQPGDGRTLLAIAEALTSGGGELAGVLTHAGDSYSLKSPVALAAAAKAERDAVVGARDILQSAGNACPIVSVGSTPTATHTENLDGVTELRAGVYMFGDLVQAGIGSCGLDDLALSVLTTVIGHQRAKGWIITDAGWMAMSRDRGTARQAVDQGYGLVCDASGRLYSDLVMIEANQEHGIVAIRKGSAGLLPDLPVGTRLRILPNHACATAAQFDAYHVLGADGRLTAEWPRMRGW